MAKFELDTDELTQVASEVSKLSSNISGLASEVSGFDTANEDGFDFAGAQKAIAEAIEACADKMNNASKTLQTVAETHTELQNSLKYDESKDYSKGLSGKKSGKKAKDSTASDEASADTSSSSGSENYSTAPVAGAAAAYSSSSSGGSSSGGHSSSSSSSSSGTSSSSSNTGKSSNEDSKTATEYTGLEDDLNKEDTSTENTDNGGTTTDNPTTEVPTVREVDGLSDVNYAYIKEDTLTDESKLLLNNASFDTTTSYSMMDGRYVVACDSSVGNVGDVVRFTKTDGTTTECIVGINTVSDQYKGSINFLVDRENWANVTPLDVSKNILVDNTKVENLGNYMSLTNTSTTTTNTENTSLEEA